MMVVMLILLTDNSWARSKRVNQIPNGSVNKCANCHIDPGGGGPRNDFGIAVQSNFLDGSGNVIWSYDLAKLDSDGDGLPNGVELLDPNAEWSIGSPAPGLLDRVRLPGDNTSKHGDVLTVQFKGMTPHEGQKFEIRVVDEGTQEEKGLQTMASIPVDFQLFFTGMEMGKNYRVDFYADHNNNGVYDPPSVDHAWRLAVNDFAGDTIETFSHNTNFTDIGFPTAIAELLSFGVPTSYELNQNYPNPFNPSTTLRFSIPEAEVVSLTVYNSIGQHVRTLLDNKMGAGDYEVRWDGKDEAGYALSTGVYFYQISAGDFKQAKRMMLVR